MACRRLPIKPAYTCIARQNVVPVALGQRLRWPENTHGSRNVLAVMDMVGD